MKTESVRFTWLVRPWMKTFDSLTSFDEKAAFIGINTSVLSRKVTNYKNQDPEKTGLLELVVIYHGELGTQAGRW